MLHRESGGLAYVTRPPGPPPPPCCTALGTTRPHCVIPRYPWPLDCGRLAPFCATTGAPQGAEFTRHLRPLPPWQRSASVSRVNCTRYSLNRDSPPLPRGYLGSGGALLPPVGRSPTPPTPIFNPILYFPLPAEVLSCCPLGDRFSPGRGLVGKRGPPAGAFSVSLGFQRG